MNKFNNRAFVILGIFILLIAALGVVNYFDINLPLISMVERVVYNFLSSIIEGINNLIVSVKNFFYRFNKAGEIIAENEKLRRQLADQKVENLLIVNYKYENERLRKLLDFKKQSELETTGAEVIGYGPSKWKNKILINKGKEDGLKKGMTVVTYEGAFLGQVDYISNNSAQVKLLNDSEFVVAGIVKRNDSRAIGLVKGELNEDDYNIMDNLSWEADIKKDDVILTSGLSNNFPEGLRIGKVVEVESANYGVSQKAKIELFMDAYTIEEVLVITDY